MRTIIVTDLTRFGEDKDILCMAGIDINTGECIRPMPYLKIATVEKYQILPGFKLNFDSSPKLDATRPHSEDHVVNGKYSSYGACTEEEFLNILERSTSDSLSEGFNFDFNKSDHKYKRKIPANLADEIQSSIVTIEIEPGSFKLFEDDYNPGKVKVSFKSPEGLWFRYVPITDFGFYTYIKNGMNDLHEIESYINNSEKVFLRIGLGREYQDGFWVQANGVYTFPGFHEKLRSYERT